MSEPEGKKTTICRYLTKTLTAAIKKFYSTNPRMNDRHNIWNDQLKRRKYERNTVITTTSL